MSQGHCSCPHVLWLIMPLLTAAASSEAPVDTSAKPRSHHAALVHQVTGPPDALASDPTAGLPPETPDPTLDIHLPAEELATIHALVIPTAPMDFY